MHLLSESEGNERNQISNTKEQEKKVCKRCLVGYMSLIKKKYPKMKTKERILKSERKITNIRGSLSPLYIGT